MRHGDADILSLMETTVPPADISKVSIFSAHLARYAKEAGFKKQNRFMQSRITVSCPDGSCEPPEGRTAPCQFIFGFFLQDNHVLGFRLSAQLLHTTFQQTELQFDQDMAKLGEWARKFDMYAAKQADCEVENISQT